MTVHIWRERPWRPTEYILANVRCGDSESAVLRAVTRRFAKPGESVDVYPSADGGWHAHLFSES